MLVIVVIMVCGIGLGYLLRGRSGFFLSRVISILIYALLLFLGLSVGANKAVINNFGAIGLDAFVITMGALAGSVLAAWFVYKRFFTSER